MAAKKKTGRKRFHRQRPAGDGNHPQPQRKTLLKVRPHGSDGAWQLVHPPCALERSDDLEEAKQMIEAGEFDVAVDELRWLLNGCSDLVPAHLMLGEIALEQGDLPLARGHLGYAYDICRAAFPPTGLPGPLPYALDENQALHEASEGLARCLDELGKRAMACRVLEDMLRWDPSDPLGVGALLNQWRGEK